MRNDRRRQKYLKETENELFFQDSLIEEEAFRMFYQAVEALPRQTRRVILLALDGLDNRHIAAEMGISENTVHMLKKIAYRKLKAMLREYYFLVFCFLG